MNVVHFLAGCIATATFNPLRQVIQTEKRKSQSMLLSPYTFTIKTEQSSSQQRRRCLSKTIDLIRFRNVILFLIESLNLKKALQFNIILVHQRSANCFNMSAYNHLPKLKPLKNCTRVCSVAKQLELYSFQSFRDTDSDLCL